MALFAVNREPRSPLELPKFIPEVVVRDNVLEWLAGLLLVPLPIGFLAFVLREK